MGARAPVVREFRTTIAARRIATQISRARNAVLESPATFLVKRLL